MGMGAGDVRQQRGQPAAGLPIWDDHTALLCLRGGMLTYADWASRVVGHVVEISAIDTMLVPGQERVLRRAAVRAQ